MRSLYNKNLRHNSPNSSLLLQCSFLWGLSLLRSIPLPAFTLSTLSGCLGYLRQLKLGRARTEVSAQRLQQHASLAPTVLAFSTPGTVLWDAGHSSTYSNQTVNNTAYPLIQNPKKLKGKTTCNLKLQVAEQPAERGGKENLNCFQTGGGVYRLQNSCLSEY